MRYGVCCCHTHPQTNGGVMMDVVVLYDHVASEHRVILGRDYYEPYGLTPQDTAAVMFEILLQHKVVRQHEGA